MACSSLTITTYAYGPHPNQAGDLYRPATPYPAVVCLLHGGYWRLPYARDQMDQVARDLAMRGYAVWNIGYRRVGEPGGGWPGTFDDAQAGLDYLAVLADTGVLLDLTRLILVGHSAGGQLALWLASQNTHARLRPRAVAALAPVLDLGRVHALKGNASPVTAVLGGDPKELPGRCHALSPASLLPLGVEQLILHGDTDQQLPLDLSRDYVTAAQQAGDPAQLIALSSTGHLDFLDPDSAAHLHLCRWIDTVILEQDPCVAVQP